MAQPSSDHVELLLRIFADVPPDDEDASRVYAATLVVSGHARVEVLATGRATQAGRIGASLAAIESVDTPLQRQLRTLVRAFGAGALAVGVLIVVVVQALAPFLLTAIAGSRGGIAETALPWLRVAVLAVPAILMSMAGNGWLRGVQDTVRPLRYVLVGVGVSAVLCPLLVFGWLGLPRLGLTGSAVANLVGQWLAAALFGYALLSERVSLRLRPDRLALDDADLERVMALGLDVMVQGLSQKS